MESRWCSTHNSAAALAVVVPAVYLALHQTLLLYLARPDRQTDCARLHTAHIHGVSDQLSAMDMNPSKACRKVERKFILISAI